MTTDKHYSRISCVAGDVIIHDKKRLVVKEVLCKADLQRYNRAYISCSPYDLDGITVLENTRITVGADWVHENE